MSLFDTYNNLWDRQGRYYYFHFIFKGDHITSDDTEPGLKPQSVFPKSIGLISVLTSERLNDLSKLIWQLITDCEP